MANELAVTFLELGDATSSNLEFAHLSSVFVSYGEETITETNLLEIRRRHPQIVKVKTLSRRREAILGADWEWHIVGRKYTLSMRVQAKRVQCDGTLKIRYKSQRTRLLSHAYADNMKPIYCIYCTDEHRSLWKKERAIGDCEEYHPGCLLADASDVRETVRSLGEIEHKCIPWHYLIVPSDIAKCSYGRTVFGRDEFSLRETVHYWVRRDGRGRELIGGTSGPPSIAQLNGDVDGPFDELGVHPTTEVDRQRLSSDSELEEYDTNEDHRRLEQRGIHRMLMIDVQDEVLPWESE